MTWKEELEGPDGYLAYLRGKGTSRNYVKNATATLRHLGMRFEPQSYLDLRKGDFVTWFDELRRGGLTGTRPLGDATMNFYAALTKACLRWLNDWETPKSIRGLVVGRQKSRVEGAEDFLTDGELHQVLQVMNPDKRLIFRLLRATGARPTEVLHLRRRDVTMVEHEGKTYAEVTFRDTKNGTHRTVPVADAPTIQDLRQHLDATRPKDPHAGRDAHLFPSREGKTRPLQYGSLDAYLKRKAKAAGVDKPVYPYLFRHMRATELLDAPRPIASRLMGWRSENMWKAYTHLKADDLRDYVLEEAGPGEESREERLRRDFREVIEHLQAEPGVQNVRVVVTLSDQEEPMYIALQKRPVEPNTTPD